jgi:Calcineurin-like phosphoesterase
MSTPTVLLDFSSLDAALASDSGRTVEAVQNAAADVTTDPVERAHLVASYNTAMGKLREENKGPGIMSSAENALASRLQSYLVERAVTEAPGAVRPTPGQVLEVKFDNLDVFGWLPTGLKTVFKTKPHPWLMPAPAAESIGDKFRVALFSDWGTGLYGAPHIATSIQTDAAGFNMMLHLGDTYYSGGDKEIQNRLMDVFPQAAAAVIRRALNGNHEMYSGGKGYFGAALPFFNQKSSCFAFQNANWLLVGLDTAYIDHNLDEPDRNGVNKTNQVEWLKGLVNAAGNRKVALFSHHQPFSQLDKQGPKIVSAMGDDLLQRVHAWFWGHEHRCVLYQPHAKYGFKGRCIGHGGFPEFRDRFNGTGPDAYRWVSLPKNDNAPAAEVLDGANKFIDDNGARYVPHGYVTLQFDGGNCREDYFDAAGERLRDSETL